MVDLRKSMLENVRNVVLPTISSDKNNLVNINTMVVIFPDIIFRNIEIFSIFIEIT